MLSVQLDTDEVSQKQLCTLDPRATLRPTDYEHGGTETLSQTANNPVLHFLKASATHPVGTIHQSFFPALHTAPIIEIEAHLRMCASGNRRRIEHLTIEVCFHNSTNMCIGGVPAPPPLRSEARSSGPSPWKNEGQERSRP